jgi:hypothetical protein
MPFIRMAAADHGSAVFAWPAFNSRFGYDVDLERLAVALKPDRAFE